MARRFRRRDGLRRVEAVSAPNQSAESVALQVEESGGRSSENLARGANVDVRGEWLTVRRQPDPDRSVEVKSGRDNTVVGWEREREGLTADEHLARGRGAVGPVECGRAEFELGPHSDWSGVGDGERWVAWRETEFGSRVTTSDESTGDGENVRRC